MDKNISTIGIVGRGAIGSVLGKMLEASGYRVNYWDKDDNKKTVASLTDLTLASEIIILAIPSWVNRQVASQIKVNSTQKKLIISLAKGVEEGFVLMDEVLKQSSAHQYDYGLLYGPMLAEELEAHKPTSALLALSDTAWSGCLDSLKQQRLSLEYSDQIHGIALCGVLKNIYAVAFGVHDGLDLGLNAKGVLAIKIFAEMRRVLAQFQIDPRLADGLAGIGDLLATGWSETSFNHRIGKAIAEKISPDDIKGEGVNALADIRNVLEIEDFPIINMLYQIVHARQDPQLMVTFLGE